MVPNTQIGNRPNFFFLPEVPQPAVPCPMGRVSGGYRRVMGVTFGGRSNGQIKKIGCVGKSAPKALLNPNTEKILFRLFQTPLFWAFKTNKNKNLKKLLSAFVTPEFGCFVTPKMCVRNGGKKRVFVCPFMGVCTR